LLDFANCDIVQIELKSIYLCSMANEDNKAEEKRTPSILDKLNIKQKKERKSFPQPEGDGKAIQMDNSGEFEMVATCMQNIEEELEEEIAAIGGTDIKRQKRAISFRGDLSVLYKANIWLRTALKVLKPIYHFKAHTEDQFYRKAKEYAWEELFGSDKTFYIDFAVNAKHFPHSQYIALRLKDAIVDRFKDGGMERPNVAKTDADVKIHLHIREQHVTISLDSSGEPLFKRGYRRESSAAPINETLAAALILKTKWKGEQDFFDPMCGSATIAIEAALIAANIPPNYNRTNFAFESWADYDQSLFSKILGEAKEHYREPSCKIYAQDIQSNAIRAARININAANLRNHIELKQTDFFKAHPPAESGVILMNPPYGERLNVSGDLPSFYNKIGETLKHSYTGWTAWIFSTDSEGFKNVGLKAKVKIPLMNGKLPCKLMGFELFEGKRIDMLKSEE